MVEKVDAEVVSGSGGKSATAAKTEELIDSAKDVYSQLTVRDFNEVKLSHSPCGNAVVCMLVLPSTLLPTIPYPPQ